MREAEVSLPGPVAPLKKARMIEQITAEIDHIKREIERSIELRNRPRMLCEFERPSPLCYTGTRLVDAAAADEKGAWIDEETRVDAAAKYMLEAKTLSLASVLKQSKKIVFSGDWEAAYEEERVVRVLECVDRERRRGRLVCVSGQSAGICRDEVARARRRMVDREMERMRSLELIREELEGIVDRRILYGGDGVVPGVGRDNPPSLFSFPVERAAEEERRPRREMLGAFKRCLESFSRCNSMQSSRGSFQTVFPSGMHPSNHQIFKKIPAECLRCKSVREIVEHKYRNVVVQRTENPRAVVSSHCALEDSFDLCSSKSDEEVEFNFFLGERREEPRMSLESSFDRFISERPRTQPDAAHGNPRFTDFIKNTQEQESAQPQPINEFYRSFSSRGSKISFETIRGKSEKGDRSRRE